MQLIFDQYWFKKNEIETKASLQNENQQETVAEENKKLLCRYCKNHITNDDEAISIEGEQSHTFSNPANYVYTINCYRAAPGCVVVGDSTSEFTWFNNYHWQLAICNTCREQLGWLFSNDQQFYALIADRLRHDI